VEEHELLVVGIDQVVDIVGKMVELLNRRCACRLRCEVECIPDKKSGFAVTVR